MPKIWSVMRPESVTEQNVAIFLIAHMLLDERKCDPTLTTDDNDCYIVVMPHDRNEFWSGKRWVRYAGRAMWWQFPEGFFECKAECERVKSVTGERCVLGFILLRKPIKKRRQCPS